MPLSIFTGTPGDDTLAAGDSTDDWSVDADAGNDTITTGSGNDTLHGGDGNDLTNAGSGDDVFTYAGDLIPTGYDTIDGGAGFDELLALTADTVIRVSSLVGIERITAGGFANVGLYAGDGADILDFSAVELLGIVAIKGGRGNDTITGSAADDTIFGGAGNDFLAGGAGDDVFRIGKPSGMDHFDGGTGVNRILAATDYARIGIASMTNIQEIGSGGYASVVIAGSALADNLDLGSVQLNGIDSIVLGMGNDTLVGSSAADVIVGGSGADILSGGGGADRFVFNLSTESRLARFDRILDFTTGQDLIDLHAIDADTTTPGEQAFTLIGNSPFHGIAGELRVLPYAGMTSIRGDLNGDGIADFDIRLQAGLSLSAGDFIL